MSKLKLLVAAALLGLPLVACEEGTEPPPVGQIDGQVVVEGEGIDGVAVTLSSGAATTTSGGGYFSFADVEGGTYTITIAGLPADASFDQTTAEVTIAESGQTISRNFNGSWIRTASLMGMVSVEGAGLPGVTVSISGRQEAQMQTDDNGQYAFTGLRAGNYTIEISGFDQTDVAFSSASSTETVAVGATKVVPFEGVYVRESAISGQVSVEGNGLAGVTVSLLGMGADESQNTDMGGQYTFSDLRAGEYQVAISGYDANEYGFSTTSATVRVEHGRTANVPFEGILLRTGSIMGQVSVEGEGLAEVTVSLSGEGESQTTMTDNSGQYTFSDLPAGNFSVGISGYDTDDYAFETTSKSVALALGETATVPFEGTLLRTSGISGRVSVEGTGLDSVTVTLSGGDLEDDMTTMTDASGQYAIAGLAEGDYTVAISDFDPVAYRLRRALRWMWTLGDDDTQIVNFMGTHARTASVTVRLFVDEATKQRHDAYRRDGVPERPEILGMAAQLRQPLQLPIKLMGPGSPRTARSARQRSRTARVVVHGTCSAGSLPAGRWRHSCPSAGVAAARVGFGPAGLSPTADPRTGYRVRTRQSASMVTQNIAVRYHAHDRPLLGQPEVRRRHGRGAARRHGLVLLGHGRRPEDRRRHERRQRHGFDAHRAFDGEQPHGLRLGRGARGRLPHRRHETGRDVECDDDDARGRQQQRHRQPEGRLLVQRRHGRDRLRRRQGARRMGGQRQLRQERGRGHPGQARRRRLGEVLRGRGRPTTLPVNLHGRGRVATRTTRWTAARTTKRTAMDWSTCTTACRCL